jgi:small subunit ribosomal protein S13
MHSTLLLQKFGCKNFTKLQLNPDWIINFINSNDIYTKHQNIKNKLLILSFKGERHKLRMPVRGQRTRTNARTRRKRGVN